MYTKAISYSGKSLWKQCPHLWHDAYVLGNRGESGPAAERGTRLHNLLEDYFNGKIPYPSADKCLAPWQGYMEELAARSPVAEGEVAVTREWQPCGFDEPHAYFRGKKDLHIEEGRKLVLFDWKSGKEYPEHPEQGKAYVALSPGFDEYDVHFAYLDNPLVVKSWSYTAEDRLQFVEQITEEVEAIRNATEWPAIPNDKCCWCPKSWRKGGPCKRAR